ncbi:MAG: enhanced serine sensitivity protein SseB C-terminal domain-containing protein [Pedobacter sp.]|uniref:enhanced serine sensitivity protein SseB C-terminal domain-containing protein n=1 Tax=Pedobacter sp. TaxID=1411316 RepID=UPI0033923BB8
MISNKSFIDNLVRVLAANPAIEKAYFGLLYNDQLDKDDLFLGVEHEGGAEVIQNMTEIVRQTFLPNREIYFASTGVQPDLFEFIESTNFPFYIKNRSLPLNMAIMNQWFDPEAYRTNFMYQVRTAKVTSLFKDFDPMSNVLNVQTFVRDGKEFIPLFSEREMIFKSGMTQVPSDLTPLEFDLARIDEAGDRKKSQHFYVLNPGTSFEVEFNA